MSKGNWKPVGTVYRKEKDDGPGPFAVIAAIVGVIVLMASCAG